MPGGALEGSARRMEKNEILQARFSTFVRLIRKRKQ